jgi:hypothetical protein
MRTSEITPHGKLYSQEPVLAMARTLRLYCLNVKSSEERMVYNG